MSVTVLFLVIFEADSDEPEFMKVEKFIVYQCLLLVADLLFFLFRSTKNIAPENGDGYESMTQRIRRMSCIEVGNCCVSLLLYTAQIIWLLYGNYIYFNLNTKEHLD